MFEHKLNNEDDLRLWNEVLHCLSEDTALMLSESSWKGKIHLRIGACSHWLRPHQTRWTANGGFAWPSGYGNGSGYSRYSLPKFDWSVMFVWDDLGQSWKAANRIEGKKNLILRVSVPTRTIQHNQAAIHSIWKQGTPENPNQKLTRFYGFRKKGMKWEYVAFQDI